VQYTEFLINIELSFLCEHMSLVSNENLHQ